MRNENLSLEVKRTIQAPAEKLFEFWTQPEHLRNWWGPEEVTCSIAEVDLQVGGKYRLSNVFPDGSIIWITGEFEQISPPQKLIYTWKLSSNEENCRVTVYFEAKGKEIKNQETEVTIFHERIPNQEALASHKRGWVDCLNGLTLYVSF